MKLPVHLNALRAFEASARHQSFAGAAAELHVSAAAVGQLVRSLEDSLGLPLFHRSSSGRQRLLPSAAAVQALPDIRAGFERLAAGLTQLQQARQRPTLTVTCSPAFAAKWLLPRIERFQAAWPGTELRLDTSLKPADFVAQNIDLGIRYGSGHWPGLLAEPLLQEELFPVCAPRLLQNGDRLREPADLLREVLIHDHSMDGHADFPDWPRWLREVAGLRVAAELRGLLHINNSAAVLQAASEGQGVALARSVMAREDLAAGRLQRLFPALRWASPLAYHVVYREAGRELPQLQAFRDWLFAEAASERGTEPGPGLAAATMTP